MSTKDSDTTVDKTQVASVSSPAGSVSREQIETLWAGSIGKGMDATMTLKPRRPEAPAAAEKTSSSASVADRLNLRQQMVAEAGYKVEPPAQYEILDLLGEGGMGVVYAARQTSVDRKIALKMIKPEAAREKENRNKFLSEAVATADLDHPNIVPIHDLGSNDAGVLFYAMKEVKGTSWKDVIQKKSLVENLDILMRVADAVAFAHSKGVIHRDLKPENVMLGDFGEVMVMDWGLAASVNEAGKADRLSEANGFGGTPCYMAPEMVTGDVSKLGPRTDVYLLGAILYEIVTGHRPHESRNPFECLEQAANNTIQPTDKQGELVDMALRAMATAPEDRFGSVKDFQAALREYQAHAQSIALATAAQEGLARAKRSGTYDDYAQALFGFREALRLWAGNDEAEKGLSGARLAYAECAFAKGDYDLAISLLDEKESSHAALRAKAAAARRERDARQRRLKVLGYTAAGLATAVILILSAAFFWVRAERNRAVTAQARAERAEAVERQARQAMQEAQSRAIAALQKADDLEKTGKTAKTERDKALDLLSGAQEADRKRTAYDAAMKRAREAFVYAEGTKDRDLWLNVQTHCLAAIESKHPDSMDAKRLLAKAEKALGQFAATNASLEEGHLQLKPGGAFGQYRLQELIGSGKTGDGWRAFDGSNREVFLSIFTSDGDLDRLRFDKTYEMTKEIEHPGIVRMHEIGETGGVAYASVEFLRDVVNLDKHLSLYQGPERCRRSVLTIKQILEVMDLYHQRGIKHRGISPQSLVVVKDGAVKFMYFNWAFKGERDRTTPAGTPVGTPAFMAPEQWVDSRTVDIRADLYSLGATYYQILGGTSCYEGKTPDEIKKNATNPNIKPKPLSEVAPEVPSDLAGLIMKLIEKKPENRFQTPREALEALSRIKMAP